MLIEAARIAIDASNAVRINLWIHNGLISFLPVSPAPSAVLHLEGYLVLPGLINAHDHLELNLFPKLGRGPYSNATHWAKDIYRPLEPPVQQHLAVPKSLRLRWGAIKNLLSGVTTVGHHNAPHPTLFDEEFPIRVVKRYGWAHSLNFSPDWKERLQTIPADIPFIIHAAEGSDEAAHREINILAEAGAFKRTIILVHGVALHCTDLPLLRSKGVSLVWCPTSNYFTLGRSVDSAVLTSGIPVALGTDSAMTAAGDILDELRVASRTMDVRTLYGMVTFAPARMLKLPAGFGRICHNGPADLVVLRDSGKSPAITLLEKYPELVMVRGRIRLISDGFARHCPANILHSLQSLELEGRGRYWIAEDIAALLPQTKQVLEGELRLAGKAVAA